MPQDRPTFIKRGQTKLKVVGRLTNNDSEDTPSNERPLVPGESRGALSAQGFRTLSMPCALIPLKGDTPEIVNDAWTSAFGDPSEPADLSRLRAGERVWVDRAKLPALDGGFRQVRLDTTVVEHGEHYGLFIADRVPANRVDRLGLGHVATVEHDLRQPLQAAQMFVDVLCSRLSDDMSSTMILSHIDRAIRTSQTMLSGLRDTALLEGGLVEPLVRAFDVGELLRELHCEARPLADQKGIRLRLFDVDGVNRRPKLTPNRRAILTPLSGTAEVVPVVNRGDPSGFV